MHVRDKKAIGLLRESERAKVRGRKTGAPLANRSAGPTLEQRFWVMVSVHDLGLLECRVRESQRRQKLETVEN